VFLVGADASRYYIHLAETDVREPIPLRSDVGAWVRAVNGMVERHRLDFIFPNNSLDGVVLSERRGELAAPVFLPSPEAFRVGENKWETWKRLQAAGIPVPRTWLISTREDIEAAFAELGSGPFWVRGAGIPGRGIGVASLPARTVEQAVQWVEFHSGWGLMSVSEYLPGANLTWLAVFRDGELVASQGRQRDAYVIPHVSPSGITGAPAISHTICRADINELGLRVCRAVDGRLTGPAFVDFKEDASGQPLVTEINVGRLGTTHHFYSAAGANFPELLLRLAFGERLPDWVRPVDVLPPDLYWIRTLDAGPVLVRGADLDEYRILRT
jgi:carbamoyl-phosphate synthase large subunit